MKRQSYGRERVEHGTGLAIAAKFTPDESKRLVAVARSIGEESLTRTLKKLVDERFASLDLREEVKGNGRSHR